MSTLRVRPTHPNSRISLALTEPDEVGAVYINHEDLDTAISHGYCPEAKAEVVADEGATESPGEPPATKDVSTDPQVCIPASRNTSASPKSKKG